MIYKRICAGTDCVSQCTALWSGVAYNDRFTTSISMIGLSITSPKCFQDHRSKACLQDEGAAVGKVWPL